MSNKTKLQSSETKGRYEKEFAEELSRLNTEQRRAVEQIDGHGTEKTH